MSRPKVITYSLASLDGKLTISPDTLLLFGDSRWNAIAGENEDIYSRLQAQYNHQAILEGSGSFCLPGQGGDPLPPFEGNQEQLYRDYLPDQVVNAPNRRWLAVVDGGGRVRWMYKEYPGEGWAGWHLMVLVCRHTAPEYLAYLQRETIPYLVTGQERIDLGAALAKLAGLGVERLVCTGGGKLTGALLRQNLIDEIAVEFFPAVIGGTLTPTLFHAPDLGSSELPTRLELLECQPLPDGHVRLHYRVIQERA